MIEFPKRRRAAVPAAIALSLLLASQATATTWSPRVALTSSYNSGAGGLVTLGSTTAVAIYTDTGRTYVRRSTDSGATWSSRVKLAGLSSWFTAIAGRGTSVDVAYSTTTSFQENGALSYRRSTNSGATFSGATTLASHHDPEGAAGFAPAVARGPGGVVAVAWHENSSAGNMVRVRTSSNGGASFASATTLANVSASYFKPPAVAIGRGVIYVAYFRDETHVSLRRSRDGGATWTAPVELAANAYGNDNIYALALTANRSAAHFAYAAKSGSTKWIRYRRTSDKGVTWTSPSSLSPSSGHAEYRPAISLQGGVIRVAYESCEDTECGETHVTYRQSSNGTTWTAEETASHAQAGAATPAGVGYAGRIIVLYTGAHYRSIYDQNSDVYVRRGV